MILPFLAIIGPGFQTIYAACQKERMKSEERKKVIFNCSPSPASPYDLLVWCQDSLQPYTQGPSHFFLRRSQDLTQEIFTLEQAMAFMPS
jgi:hypothetical protein